MKKRKLIAVLLCIAIFLTSFGPITLSYASGGTAKAIADKIGLSKIVNTFKPEPPKLKNQRIDIKPEKTLIFSGTRKSIFPEPLKHDKYNYSSNDLKQLLKEGYSAKDIFKADELGNTIDAKPADLLKEKTKTKKSWDQLEKDIKTRRVTNSLNELKTKLPKEFQQIQGKNLSVEEQTVLLSMFKNHYGKSLDELVQIYKVDGKEGLSRLVSDKKAKNKVSLDKMNKHGLTTSDVEGLSDEIINGLEIVSQRSNIPIKQLISNYKADQNGKKVIFKGGN